MVRLCVDKYTLDNDAFTSFPFPLSDFQKYAIEAIQNDKHVLITAHTGSGKTLPAEYAISYFLDKGKRVIYTSPIKALSNQKYEDLSVKFPGKIGLLTGDITRYPDAPVLIMTTEILRGKLRRDRFDPESNHCSRFNMDIENDLGCVIFDEVHYFSDRDRGIVWEECLMYLPRQVSLVLLSATLANPESFANWIENKRHNNGKEVYLIPTNFRVVPLKHYGYITIKEGDLKWMKEKDKVKYSEYKDIFNTLIPLKENDFNVDNRKKLASIKSCMFDKNFNISPKHVLNIMLKMLYNEDMTPCVCFVLNKEILERYANSIEHVFFEPEEKIPIEEECRHILQSIDNRNEYMVLPQYTSLINMLKRGVAIHHASMLPVLREMVEKLYVKGYIKVLFCTETFAVGINMPVKTTIMTSLSKFDGSGKRYFLPSEYTQMAGRAGRRGIDTVGHVIHLNNMFDMLELVDYKTLMCGTGVTLSSKYTVTYDAILFNAKKGIDIDAIVNATNNSYVNMAIDAEYKSLIQQKEQYSADVEPEGYNSETLEQYFVLLDQSKIVGGNARKKVYKQLNKLEKEVNEHHKQYYEKKREKEKDLAILNNKIHNLNTYFRNQVTLTTTALVEMDYINDNKLTLKGEIALSIQELPGTVFAELFVNEQLDKLESWELVKLFSIYNNVPDHDNENHNESNNLEHCINQVKTYHENIINTSSKYQIIPFKDEINFKLMCIGDWYHVNDENSAIDFVNHLNIPIGDFAKGVLKVINIIPEMIKVAEITHNLELLNKLNNIPEKLSKFFITNQSLYV